MANKSIMKRLLFGGCLMAGLAIPGVSKGQVTNYSLKLTAGGSLISGPVKELDNKVSYTVQFWICPTEWTEGAEVFSRGSLKASLIEGGLKFTVGTSTLDVKSELLAANQWAQVTLVCHEGQDTAFVNNTQIATGELGTIPADENANLVLGTNFIGRIDEFRLWNAALENKFARFWNNTLNKYAPQWDDLVVYYKFDQDLSEHVVDYKTALTPETTSNHHAALSSKGAVREAVTDNTKLPYLLAGAYRANERFYDRLVEREKYLLANDLIILGIQSYSDGHLKYVTPNNHATITGGTHMDEHDGRKGVISLDGTGKIAAGVDAFTPSLTAGVDKYTLYTWIYLDEWTEGAYIFQKESEDLNNGISIRLGKADTKQVIVRVNGKNFVNTNAGLTVGKWVHFGLTVGAATSTANTFTFVYDGVAGEADESLSDGSTTYIPTNYATLEANIGVNLKAKLDEFTIWNVAYGASTIASYGNSYQMPAIGKTLNSYNMQRANTLYLFDDASKPGYDSYSQDQWLAIMKSAYDGYRGYRIRISVKSHTNWQTTIADASKRAIFAEDLAKLVEGYAGAELDLEWATSTAHWNSYNELIKAIKAVFPAGKSFVVSNHASAYSLSPTVFPLVDGFTIQQYGPQSRWSMYSDFLSSTKSLVDYGYPKEKLYLAYATTTSRAYTAAGATATSSTAVRGIKDGFMDGNYVENEAGDRGVWSGDNNYYYFTGPMQVYNRAKYAVDNNYMGIFYWDMGNENPINHKYVLAKYSNYGLSANVDTLITEVTLPIIIVPELDSTFISETESTISEMSQLVGFVNGYKAENVTAIQSALDTYKETISHLNKTAVSTAINDATQDLVAFSSGKYYRVISGATTPWNAYKTDGIYRSIYVDYSAKRMYWGKDIDTSVDYLWKIEGTLSSMDVQVPNLEHKHITSGYDLSKVSTTKTSFTSTALTGSGNTAVFNLKWGAKNINAAAFWTADGAREINNVTTGDGERWYLKQIDTLYVNVTGTYGTINLPFAVKIPSGIKAYYGKTDNGTTITLSPVNDIVPANTPVVIAADAPSATTQKYAFAISYDNPGTAIESNLLSGVTAPASIAQGSYVLASSGGVEGFYPVAAAGTLAANKVYILASKVSGSSYLGFNFNDLTTIESATTTTGSVSEVYYDLNGRRVANPKSGGIYVTASGKKVLFK